MAKSPKNKKKKHSRSTSPQMNAPMQRTPSGPAQRTTRVVANAVTTGVQQIILSQTQDKSHNVGTYKSFSTGIVER